MRRRGVRPGALVVSYLALHAISQIVIFQWRASEPTVLLGPKQAQITGLVVLLRRSSSTAEMLSSPTPHDKPARTAEGTVLPRPC